MFVNGDRPGTGHNSFRLFVLSDSSSCELQPELQCTEQPHTSRGASSGV